MPTLAPHSSCFTMFFCLFLANIFHVLFSFRILASYVVIFFLSCRLFFHPSFPIYFFSVTLLPLFLFPSFSLSLTQTKKLTVEWLLLLLFNVYPRDSGKGYDGARQRGEAYSACRLLSVFSVVRFQCSPILKARWTAKPVVAQAGFVG